MRIVSGAATFGACRDRTPSSRTNGVMRARRQVRPFTCFAGANKALRRGRPPLNQATIDRDGLGRRRRRRNGLILVLQRHHQPIGSPTCEGVSAARRAAPIDGVGRRQDDVKEMLDHVEQITLKEKSVEITFAIGGFARAIKVPWNQVTPSGASVLAPPPVSNGMSNQKLLQAVVRAHVWLKDLSSSRFHSIEALASAANLHPKNCASGVEAGVPVAQSDIGGTGSQPAN